MGRKKIKIKKEQKSERGRESVRMGRERKCIGKNV
jgi:hypothetical protein